MASGFTCWMRAFQGKNDKVVSLQSFHQSLIIYGKSHMERLEYNLTPVTERVGYDDAFDDETDYTVEGDGRLYGIPGERGAVSHDVVKDCDGILMALDVHGFHAFDGGQPRAVDAELADYDLPAEVAWDYSHLFHAVFLPDEREYICFLCYGSETTPKTAFVWHRDTALWHTYYFDNGVDAVTVAHDSAGRSRLFLGQDPSGLIFMHGTGYSDGIPSGTTCRGTVASGATTTGFTMVGGGMHSGTGDWSNLYGRYAYWREGGEARKIQSNTTAAVIMASAFSSAPSAGDTMYLGRIPFEYETRAFEPQTDLVRHSPMLHLRFVPVGGANARYLRVRVYEDLSATAKQDWETKTGDGWITTVGSPDILVNMAQTSGHIDVPISSGWKRYVSFKFFWNEPECELEILEYMLETQEDKEDDPLGARKRR